MTYIDKAKQRPILGKTSITCVLCKNAFIWRAGVFSKHLKTHHEMTTAGYYELLFGEENTLCLCGCREKTAWEPRHGYHKNYISGHNYRGKTKDNDPSVALRTQKTILTSGWAGSTFTKGQLPWNKASTDLIYLEKLFTKTRFKMRTSGIRKGLYTSEKTGQQFYYDSGWELDRMKWYDSNGKIRSWSRCKDLIPYVDENGQLRHYNPDFLVSYDTKTAVEEIKGGRFGANLSAKIQAAAKFYQEKNLSFHIITKRQDKFIEVPLHLFNRKEQKTI